MNQAVLSAKQNTVAEIADKIKDSQSTVIVEYRGLSVAEVNELRRNLRNEAVDFKVYKNTMAQRAVDECGFNGLKDFLTGPNAMAFSKDATAPARILSDFAKKHKALVLKSGIVEGKEVDLDTLKELASLPNRDGMLSMLLSCLQSPVRSFACIVKAVADAKESGEFKVADAPAEAPKEEAPAAAEAKEEAPKEEAAKEEAPAKTEAAAEEAEKPAEKAEEKEGE
ncbi:MAG: 50S ribosomal protein L10 [Erysipelotrichaceae bacterium]|nr:50S ribosomal protein L10 [Erysipelotrichaceae bacterium]